jgi:hypothetical protein
MVYEVGPGQVALEINFGTPSQRQRRTEELRAAIQTPQSAKQSHPYESGDVSELPLTYPKYWKGALVSRGYLFW